MTATQSVGRIRSDLARRFDPAQVGWRIGAGHQPRSGELWCPWDRTAGVIGPQGSGKTLDLLTPALISAPGAAMVTLTMPGKDDDGRDTWTDFAPTPGSRLSAVVSASSGAGAFISRAP